MPDFDFKLIFENDFFFDEYIFETDKSNLNYFKQSKYNIKKNDEFIGSLFLEDYNLHDFMDKFLIIVEDYDVSKLYHKNIKTILSEKYSYFINSFENSVVKKPNNLIGEIYKMRRAAGLV